MNPIKKISKSPVSASDIYRADFSRLEKQFEGKFPDWLIHHHRAGMERFLELGFPTPSQEEWKYTQVSPITRIPFQFPRSPATGLKSEQVDRVTFANLKCPRMVFVNGYYCPRLSHLEDLPNGVRVGSLAEFLKRKPNLLEHDLARCVDYRDHAFVALNTAFIQDGAFLHIPKGQVIETPIHLLYLVKASQEPLAIHPRNLIVADANSQAAILESYVGLDDGTYFTNLVTEIIAGENAVVDHYKLHQESKKAYHISTLQVQQARNSKVRSFNVTLGGALTRNEINVTLDGEGAECSLDGLYLMGGSQHVDNHTQIEHKKPHCSSREIYKGILDGRSTGVFHGRILVAPGAQKTDSKQTNNNLLLSDDALVTSKPQLEIYADDVKCTHGATIGQLSDDALFYLRSRGIDYKTARSLLIYAFASEVVHRIRVNRVRVELDEYLFSWLPRGDLVREAV